jgi:hypothetical protein
MIKKFAKLMIGIPLIGAASSQVNSMDSGMAKTMAGTAVGLGSIGLATSMIPKTPKSKPMKYTKPIKHKKLKW